MTQRWLRQLASGLAKAPVLSSGKHLFLQNQAKFHLPLTKWQKLLSGVWLILNDYATGRFPPRFPNRQEAHEAERNYRQTLSGVTVAEVTEGESAKPFWYGGACRFYLNNFSKLLACLERLNLQPPARLLELGCGSGWMAEFLTNMNYRVVGTTIAEYDAADARKRAQGLKLRFPKRSLEVVVCPMETVHSGVSQWCPFDAVFVYEALHHAFNWREAIASNYRCLRDGGWLLICNEPNALHTFISYRVARLSNTHEIGFWKGDLVKELRAAGFKRIIDVGPRLHFFVRPHWLLAQK